MNDSLQKIVEEMLKRYDDPDIEDWAIRLSAIADQQPVAILHVRENETSASYSIDELSVFPLGSHPLYAAIAAKEKGDSP